MARLWRQPCELVHLRLNEVGQGCDISHTYKTEEPMRTELADL
jgi:hypothetical protein